jgi:hypothetical protein
VTDLRRLFLWALVVSLSATALLAIGFLLLADFDDRTWKIIATTALISGFSLLAMPGGALLDRGRAVMLGWATLALAGYSLAHALFLLWTEDETGWKVLVGGVAFTGACSQASATTSRWREDDSQAVRALYFAGIGGAFFVAALVVLAAWQEIEDDGFYRFLGAVAVAVLLVTILQPIVRRAGGGGPRRQFAVTVVTDDGEEVERELDERDFAAAAAAAIRAAERAGRTVVRVERR